MQLIPKKTKHRKVQKSRLLKFTYRSDKLRFGSVGLKATQSGTISSRQIEAARQAIVRKTNRKGKLWIRIFPSLPITVKPIEVRMGKGKGTVSHWCAKIKAGMILFETHGIPHNAAILAFKTGGAKLPIKTVVLF